jgi:hypothetical protein
VNARCPNSYERFKRRCVWFLMLALQFSPVFGGFLHAQQDERAVRAAFVFNLTKYVTWPQPRQRLVIGVVGQGNMGPVLKQVLEGKASDGRQITVLTNPSDVELRECDVLYVAESSAARIRSTLDRVTGRAILTVGESDQFAHSGGMVALVRSGDQIEIEVNLAAVRSRRLEMSSRLLNLAVLVSPGGDAR